MHNYGSIEIDALTYSDAQLYVRETPLFTYGTAQPICSLTNVIHSLFHMHTHTHRQQIAASFSFNTIIFYTYGFPSGPVSRSNHTVQNCFLCVCHKSRWVNASVYVYVCFCVVSTEIHLPHFISSVFLCDAHISVPLSYMRSYMPQTFLQITSSFALQPLFFF